MTDRPTMMSSSMLTGYFFVPSLSLSLYLALFCSKSNTSLVNSLCMLGWCVKRRQLLAAATRVDVYKLCEWRVCVVGEKSRFDRTRECKRCEVVYTCVRTTNWHFRNHRMLSIRNWKNKKKRKRRSMRRISSSSSWATTRKRENCRATKDGSATGFPIHFIKNHIYFNSIWFVKRCQNKKFNSLTAKTEFKWNSLRQA